MDVGRTFVPSTCLVSFYSRLFAPCRRSATCGVDGEATGEAQLKGIMNLLARYLVLPNSPVDCKLSCSCSVQISTAHTPNTPGHGFHSLPRFSPYHPRCRGVGCRRTRGQWQRPRRKLPTTVTATATVEAGPTNGSRTVGRVTRLWTFADVRPAANGVVHYGYNSTFGTGFNNATQIRLAYRGCEGRSVSFSTNQRLSGPEVNYGTSNLSLVSRPGRRWQLTPNRTPPPPRPSPSPTRPAPSGRTT